MLRLIPLVGLLLVTIPSFAQEKTTVTVKGYAPTYVGATIEFNQTEDYITMREKSLASTTVKADSTFEVTFFVDETKKIALRSNKNFTSFYVQPKAKYDIYLPAKDQYEPFRPQGNKVEVTFFDLDSTDINYKILSYLRWQDNYIGNYYYLKNVKPLEFATKVDEFKEMVQKQYKSDTTDFFFKTFVRYNIASLDNIQNIAERNRYEKYDFYLKTYPVSYQNDAYMAYVNSFFEKMTPRLHEETNNKMYQAILKSSPTLVMKALGSEYTLSNLRLREMVMIKTLGENFYSDQYPQTNILAILDSVANKSLFEGNEPLARNMIIRLTDLVPGGKTPEFAFTNSKKETKTLGDYKGQYIYFHFMNPEGIKSTLEIEPLVKLHAQYKDDITFVTFISNENKALAEEFANKIPWESVVVGIDHAMIKKFKISSFPQYVLIDETGHIVGAPALSPMPNGQYETIDKTFFYIKEARAKMKEYRR
ncbi:MAG: hypothetical protein V4638_08445 [Bacteroidota bacterium]